MNIVFDGENKLIKIMDETHEPVLTIDIQLDIYSAWKEWMQIGDNAKFLPALRTIGGDPTTGVKTVSPYFFLLNGWKFKPCSECHHTINLVGNLFEEYDGNIFVPSDGYFTVLVNMSTTSDAISVLGGSGVTAQDKQDIANLILSTGISITAQDKQDIADLAKRKLVPLLFAK